MHDAHTLGLVAVQPTGSAVGITPEAKPFTVTQHTVGARHYTHWQTWPLRLTNTQACHTLPTQWVTSTKPVAADCHVVLKRAANALLMRCCQALRPTVTQQPMTTDPSHCHLDPSHCHPDPIHCHSDPPEFQSHPDLSHCHPDLVHWHADPIRSHPNSSYSLITAAATARQRQTISIQPVSN
jgi:hypothetical protein